MKTALGNFVALLLVIGNRLFVSDHLSDDVVNLVDQIFTLFVVISNIVAAATRHYRSLVEVKK